MTSCHACGSTELTLLKPAEPLPAVSSDIQIADSQYQLAHCPSCGLLQKCVTPEWQAAVDKVYQSYRINHQSDGADPYIFESQYGAGPRADILMRHLDKEGQLPHSGRFLDIGCGNGNILKSFARHYPQWKLSGVDGSGLWGDVIRAIPGVEGFASSLDAFAGQKFDVIVMSHVLEHIPNPAAYLRHLRDYMNPGALLFIAVPDIRQNPIDLFVIDHCTHFDEIQLYKTFSDGAMSVQSLRGDLLGKELVVLARLQGEPVASPQLFIQPLETLATNYLTLCLSLLQHARELRPQFGSFAIMGTSTAAAWLSGGLNMNVDFFVDEDPQRIGKQAFGKPIMSLANVPTGSCVFIPMAREKARQIIDRAGRKDVEFAYLAENDVREATRRVS